jgi:hypothetical protein
MNGIAVIKELKPKRQGYRIEVYVKDKPVLIREYQYLQEAHDHANKEGYSFQVAGSDGPMRGYWEIWWQSQKLRLSN